MKKSYYLIKHKMFLNSCFKIFLIAIFISISTEVSSQCPNGDLDVPQYAIASPSNEYGDDQVLGAPDGNGNNYWQNMELEFASTFTSGAVVTIRSKANSGYVGTAYNIDVSVDGSTWVENSGTLTPITAGYTDITYTLPLTAIANYKYIKINASPAAYSNIDAVTVTSTVCNPCDAGSTAPTFTSGNSIATIGQATFDLSTVGINNPEAKTLTWHYFLPANSGNKVADVNSVLSDTYYVAFEGDDAGSLCYSEAAAFTIVGDFDGDGIPDSIDLDDDNDGILDVLECPKSITSSGSFNYVSSDFANQDPGWVKTANDGSIYTVRLQAQFPTADPFIGQKDNWKFHNTVDWTEGQYIHSSVYDANLYHPVVEKSITDGGAFIIFSRDNEAISNDLTGLTIGKNYVFTYEMGFLPEYDTAGNNINYNPSTYLDVTGANVLSSTPIDYTAYSAADFPATVTPTSTALNPHWTVYSVIFQATSTNANIKLGANNTSAVITVDAVNVVEIPVLPICTKSLNTDSDGDGCLDSIEAGVDDGTGNVGSGTVGANGVYDNLETSVDSGILKNPVDIATFPYDSMEQSPSCPACTAPDDTLIVTDPSVCISDTVANIVLEASETGVTYQLRLESDDSNIGASQLGDGNNLTFNITPLPANGTTYNIYAVDATCNVELTDKAIVTVNTLPVAPSASDVDPTCSLSTGSVSVTSPVGTSTYTLTGITPAVAAQTGTSFSSLASGTYELTETNAAGCTSPALSITIDAQPSTPVAPSASDVDPTCSVATGSVSVTSPVGTSTYTLTGITPAVAAQTGTSFSSLASGTYELTETNAAGCTSPALSITIDAQPSTPVAPSASDVDPTCSLSTGSVSVTSPVGTSTYTLTGITPAVAAQTGTSFSSLASGTYELTETNAAGCTSPALSITIDAQPSTPVAPSASDVDPTCSVATGSVSVTSPVGTSTYTLTGITPAVAAQTGTSFSSLASGTYELTETNAAGCTSPALSITIDAQPSTPVAPSASDVDPTCSLSTGSVSVTSPVGTSTYTLTGITPAVAAQTGTSFSSLASGTYELTETNAAGCTSPALSITIDAQPSTPVAPSASDVDPTCSVATGSVSVTSPVGTSTYTLTGITPAVAAQTGTSFSSLASGTYELTETNAAGCTSPALSITIDAQPSTPVAPSASDVDPTCSLSTGSVSVTSPVGTSTYTLTGITPAVAAQTGTSFSSLASGTYELTETNAAGCTSPALSITIDAQPSTPVAPSASDVDPTCSVATGSVSVTSPVGTSTYTLTGITPAVAAQTGTSFSSLASGTYELTETNAAGCTSPALSITIDAQPSTPVAPSASDVDPTCSVATGSVSVTSPVGTSTYTLTGITPAVAAQTGTSFSSLASGTYELTETNAAGCTSPALSITIDAQPSTPVAPSASDVDPTCSVATGSVSVTSPVGTSTYTLTGITPAVAAQTGTSFSSLASGTYELTETNAAGCTSPALSITIDAQPSTPVAPSASDVDPTCSVATGSVSVTSPVGTSTYTLTGITPAVAAQTGTSFSSLASGTYELTETNAAGCTSPALSITIDAQPSTPVAPSASDVDPTCSVATGSVSVTSPVGTSTYTLTGITPAVAAQTGTSFSSLVSGTYELTETNAAGCTSPALSITIDAQPSTPVAPSASDVDPTCSVATGSVSVTSPVGTSTYTLTGITPAVAAQIGTSFSSLASGTYELTETNAAGCTSPALSITIDAQPSTPVAPSASDVDPTCSVATGSVSVTSPVGTSTYTLTGITPAVAAQTGTSFSSLVSGTYELTETNAAGCTSPALSITIDAQPSTPVAPSASDVDPTCSVATGSVSVTSPVGTSTYTLTGITPAVAAQTGTSFSSLASGTYELTETNAAGCTSPALSITIDAQPSTPVAPSASDVDPTCSVATGSVSVTSPVGTSTYTLTGITPAVAAQTGTSFSSLASGTYELTETNAAGCTSPALSITIDAQPSTPVAPSASDVDPTCSVATGSVSVTSPVGTSTYTLTGITPAVAAQTGTSFSSLASGTYELTETNAVGCTSPALSITIDAQPSTPVAPSASDVDPTCSVATGSVSVTSPVGTSTYTLTGITPAVAAQTGTSFSSLASGTYELTETNAAGCTSPALSITIDAQPSTPVAPSASDVDPTCSVATGSVSVTSPVGTSTYTLTGITPAVAAQTGTSFSSLASGTYELTETNAVGCTSPALSITIDAQPNCPPVAQDDTASTTINALVNVPVLLDNGNGIDDDVDGDTIVVSDINGTAVVPGDGQVITVPGGTATLLLDGTLDVQPDGTGTAISFPYTISDGNGGTDTASVAVSIGNTAPVAQDDTASTTINTLVNVPVLLDNGNGIDEDVDGDVIVVSDINGTAVVPGDGQIITVPGGTATLLSDGTLDVQPDGTGTAISFPYTISDGNGGTDTASVAVSIGNTAPVAQDDTASTTINTLVNVPVLLDNGNGIDEDVDGDVIVVSDINGTAVVPGDGQIITVPGGTATLLLDGTLDVQPDGTGTAISFPYTISDGNGGTDTANVAVTIGNTAPVAQDDTASTTINALVNVPVLLDNGNGIDEDVDGDVIVVSDINGTAVVPGDGQIITVPGGTATLLSDGTLDVQPDGTGTAISFPYTISDGNGGIDTANVAVTIGNTAPVAQDDTASTTINALVNVPVLLDNGNGIDDDVDGDVIVVSDINGTAVVPGDGQIITVPGGTATLLLDGTLDVQPDGTGTAISFPYTISDGNGGTDTANVAVTIGNTAPVAQDDTASTTINALVNVPVLLDNGNGIDDDVDGDVIVVSDINGTAVVPGDGQVITVPGGTATLLSDGTLDVQPDGTGTAISFPYTISDGNGGTDTANVAVSIGNTAPVAQDDTASTTINALVNVPVLLDNGNGIDDDVDGDTIVVSDINGTAVVPGDGQVITVPGGTATLLSDGTLDVQPDGTGTAISFPYTISDGNGGTDTANVAVAIGNTAPVAQDDTASTTINALVNVPVLLDNGNGIDDDVDGDTIVVSDINGTAVVPGDGQVITVPGGTATLLSDGTLDVQPDGTGTAISFPYTISDGNGGTDTANVAVSIGNTAPVAQDDTASTTINALVNVPVLLDNGNGIDDDVDGDTIVVSDINGTAVVPGDGQVITVPGGTATLLSDGTLDVQPDGTGTAISFPYTISDGNGGTDTANVAVSIGNTAPVAQDDTASTTINALVNVPVLLDNGNGIDDDVDGDTIVVSDINGTAVVPGDGQVITVPGGTATLLSDGTLDVQPDGTGTAISFPYTISDGNGGTDTANVAVSIGNTAPVAQDDTASTTINALVNVPVLLDNGNGIDDDVDGDTIVVSDINGTAVVPGDGQVITVPGGTATLLSDGTLDVQPDGTGTAISFPYTISDGNGGTDTANVAVAIGNTAPVAQDDTASTTINALVNVPVLLDNGNGIDDDVDGDTIVVSDINGTAVVPGDGQVITVPGGTATLLSDGTLDVQPDGTGTAISFPYTISDGNGGTDTANVAVAIGNTAPVAQDDTASTTINALVNVPVLLDNGNGIDDDVDGDTIVVSDINGTAVVPGDGQVITVPGGTATLLSDGTLDVQPDGTGTAISFPYTISDGNGGTDTANVAVAIGNTAPVAQDDTASTTINALVNVPVLLDNGNGIDDDVDGDTIVVSDINGTAVVPGDGQVITVPGGTATLLSDGTLDVQPDGTGTAISFPYTISDGNGGTDTANVAVAIGNTAPVAQDDTASTTINALVNVPVLLDNGNGIDDDVDGDTIVVSDINGTAVVPGDGQVITVPGGTATLLSDGTLDVQPDGTGTAISFPYTISDGNGGTDTANVAVAIGNTAPVAQDDTASTTINALVNVPVLLDNGNGIDDDVDGDTIVVSDINGTAVVPGDGQVITVPGGTATLLSDGTLDVQPDGTGTAISFPYTISDGNGGTDTANVAVAIGNTAPVAQDDTASTTINALVNVPVLLDNGNGIDDDVDGDTIVVSDINGTAVVPGDGQVITVPGGTATLLSDGTLDVQPDGTGTAISFPYTISDGNGGTDTANVAVAIGNTAPVAQDDTASTTINALVNVPVLLDNGNGIDDDVDGDTIVVSDINGTAVVPGDGQVITVPGGTATLLSDGTLDVQPDGTGTAISFPYTISDGNGGTDTANVAVAIGNTAPVAQDDTASTTINALVNVPVLLDNGNGIDDDVDGDTIVVSDINGTAVVPGDGQVITVPGGTATLLSDGTLDVQPDGTGTAISFPYTISDGNGGTDTANVAVAIGNTAPVAQDDTASTTINALVNVPVLLDNGNGIDDDVDGDTIVVSDINGTAVVPGDGQVITVPGGTATLLSDGTLDVQPDGTGTAISFPYTISDGNGGTDTANVAVSIGNTAPVAQDDTASTTINALVNVPVLLDNGNGIDDDVDGDTIVVSDINGTAVVPGDGQVITVPGGTATLLSDGTLDVQPDGTGTAISFPYTISDGNGGTDTANVAVAIGNTAPVAQDDTASTTINALVNVPVLLDNGNGIDDDVDGDTIVVSDINGTAVVPGDGQVITVPGGTATLLSDGTLDVQPDGTGTAISFPYTISDGNGGTDTANVAVSIGNTAPVAQDDTASTTINALVNVPVLLDNGNGIDDDVDGDTIVVSDINGTAVVPGDGQVITVPGGTATLLSDGTLDVQPDGTGTAISFPYTISDGNGGTDTANVAVSIGNTAPVAQDDTASTTINALVNVPVLLDNGNGIDDDVDGDTIVVSDINGTAVVPGDGQVITVPGGTATLLLDGTLDVQPDGTGTAISFPYTISDGNGGTDTANVLIDISDTNLCGKPYNIITPDNDGENDVFFISCIDLPKYANNHVEIFNRWGNTVYKASGYNNKDVAFRGISNGRATLSVDEELPPGTYYYVIDLGDGSKVKVGWLYINR
ncbi:Ig-like domain-containing protein [Tenacibaculum aestuariivivum]|uniref:Ig-like domain-containing protein n=1 Tax=Tenacibaculum aestuariivivum TaxID=2006131 RepID=UPI003AB180A5